VIQASRALYIYYCIRVLVSSGIGGLVLEYSRSRDIPGISIGKAVRCTGTRIPIGKVVTTDEGYKRWIF